MIIWKCSQCGGTNESHGWVQCHGCGYIPKESELWSKVPGALKERNIDSLPDITDDQLISMIKDIRARNNGYWMDILKLAFKHAPDEARELMRNIKKCDQDITDLTEKLTRGDSTDGM